VVLLLYALVLLLYVLVLLLLELKVLGKLFFSNF
jgi:hypothetical protein